MAVALLTLSRWLSQFMPTRLKIQPPLCPRLKSPTLHGFLFQHSANNWPLKYAATIPSRNLSANFTFKWRSKMRMARHWLRLRLTQRAISSRWPYFIRRICNATDRMDSPSKRARPHKQRPPLVSPVNGENIWAWGSQLYVDFSRVVCTRSAIPSISSRPGGFSNWSKEEQVLDWHQLICSHPSPAPDCWKTG